MKRKGCLKRIAVLTLCGFMLCSCTKKVGSSTAVVIPPTDTTIKNNIVYKDLVTTDWKGIVWDPYAKDWNHAATIKDGQQIAAAGIQWTRLWVTADNTNSVNDSMVSRCTSNNIKIVACYVKTNPSKDLGDLTQQAEQVASLKSFVNRYKATIKYYEIGNENNLISYWNTSLNAYVTGNTPGETGRGSTDPNSIYNAGVRRYVQWLHLAYDAIKQTDPTATVILGGVSSYILEDFMDRFTIEKGYLYCDEVAFHPYAETSDLSISRLNAFKAKVAKWPAPMNNPPIWITEFGFNDTDETKKAANLSEFMPKMIQNLTYSRPIFWYIFHDNTFGLVSQAVSGSNVTTTFFPSYYAYQALNQSWSYYQMNSNNLAINPGFESNGASQTPSGWSESYDVAASYTDNVAPHGGIYKLSHGGTAAYEAYTYQDIKGLTNGLYTLKAWVKRSGAQSSCQLEAKSFGGITQLNVSIPISDTWTQVVIPNINVTNTLCTIGLYSKAAANESCSMDDVIFYKQ